MTSFTIEDSANYAAQVVRVPAPFSLPNADRLVGLGIFGYTVITQKDGTLREGDLAVFFPAECQISDALAWAANLYRHAERNIDPSQTGYLEDNRRVRALKLRGTVSNGLILPVSVVADAFGVPESDFVEGTAFDAINGDEVSRKYRVKEPAAQVSREAANVKKAFKRVTDKQFPVHIETDQYLRNEHLISDEDILIVTQKLHGTSFRAGRVPVRRKLTWLERLAKRLGVKVAEAELDVVFGSRQVIKDIHNPHQAHYYGVDLWSAFGQTIEDRIPSNVIVYGELVGWTRDGAAIQSGHTYGVPHGAAELYLYRVAIVTDGGDLYDLSWDQVRTFANEHGFNHVAELWRGAKRDFVLENFVENDFAADFYMAARSGFFPFRDIPVSLSEDGTGADEGIAIRVDRGGRVPLLFKHKNPSHFLFETAQLDAGEVDLESAESVPA
ncbi:RNA ligase family protein [Microbacterium sp. BG28]|uniref:RNA ligase family protein n=1 Tax=Microbacterium sp. BG28 TaxID=3097356 RepID=UPI002A5A42F2|nr:RNA ligase family protein [Microbacterium sp. BG28]MDY0829078.1 RNA ligase family protein [Microbacterium sp. BG28]